LRPIAMVGERDALINVLGMVDAGGPLAEDSRSEDEIYDLPGDAPNLRDWEVAPCPTSTYGLPGPSTTTRGASSVSSRGSTKPATAITLGRSTGS
jgi:hypothetical protein